MYKTPIHSWHIDNNATMVSFANWHMPMHYGSQLLEHKIVREQAGIFDVSHMQVVDIFGIDANNFLRYLLANDIAKLNNFKALYSCMLNEQGGILDDLICYKISDSHYRLVVNAATAKSDLKWIEKQKNKFNINIKADYEYALIALQGPKAELILNLILDNLSNEILVLKPFNCLLAKDIFIARTGYTGEDGFEIMLPKERALEFWIKLVEKGAVPCGLGARDTLRLEAGLNLYGQDMDINTTPYEVNLGWTVSMQDSSRNFIGKDSLCKQLEQGVKRELYGLVLLGKGVLRHGQKVLVGNDEGVITSGTYSPSLSCSIAFLSAPNNCAVKEEVEVLIRKNWQAAKIVKLPFIKRGKN